MLTMALVAVMALGDLQNVVIGTPRGGAELALHDPLHDRLAQESSTAADRLSLTITFGPNGGADVEDVRAVKMLPGQKFLRVRDVSAALDTASLAVSDPAQPGRLQLAWASLLLPPPSSAALEASLIGETVEVLTPGGPLGYERSEGVLMSSGERRVLAVGDELHLPGDATLVVPLAGEQVVSTPTLELRLNQEGAAEQIALRYFMRGAHHETRYILALNSNGTATLEQRLGVYLEEGTAYPRATVKIVLVESTEFGAPSHVVSYDTALSEGNWAWTTGGVWKLRVQRSERALVLEAGDVNDTWLPAGPVLIRQVEQDGTAWTLGTAPFPQTAPHTNIEIALP